MDEQLTKAWETIGRLTAENSRLLEKLAWTEENLRQTAEENHRLSNWLRDIGETP